MVFEDTFWICKGVYAPPLASCH